MEGRDIVVLLTLVSAMLVGDRCTAQRRPVPAPSAAESAPKPPLDPDAPQPEDKTRLKTTVEFEILSGNPAAGLDAHRWVEALQDYGVTVRVRTPKEGDELGVKEKVRGTLRWVIATGELDARGTLRFPDRKLSVSDKAKLKEWIDELKLYGSQGSPDGKPMWGLTRDQFRDVFSSLSLPVAKHVQGLPLDEALAGLELPAETPLQFHTTATAHLGSLPSVWPVRPRVQGLTGGTALAVVLADYGLGFRPLRTPDGAIELVVEPLTELKDAWPIGWEPERGASPGKMAPGLFKMVPVGFDDVPLESILGAVAEVAAIPVVVNYYAAQAKKIDLKVPVSYPQKRAAYAMVLKRLVIGARLKQEYRVDERGTPFLYVTAFVSRKIEDLSPAESD